MEPLPRKQQSPKQTKAKHLNESPRDCNGTRYVRFYGVLFKVGAGGYALVQKGLLCSSAELADNPSMRTDHIATFIHDLPKPRAKCPICNQTVYSAGGVHPQCAVNRADAFAKKALIPTPAKVPVVEAES